MHYYKRNIGDYAKKAGRLSILQHGVYNLLIDAIYDREKFPTRDEAIDWVWASSQEEIDGVDLVLRKFFEVQEDGTFLQNRIKEEIEAYRLKCQKNKAIRNGKTTTGDETSGESDETSTKRQQDDNETLTDGDLTNNHKPITNNHKPKEKKNARKRAAFVKPSVEEVRAYCEKRKNTVDPQAFINFYQSKNWLIGKNKMVDWKAAVRTWEKRQREAQKPKSNSIQDEWEDYGKAS